MTTEPIENDKLTRLEVVASSAVLDTTTTNNHLRHKKSTTCVIDSLRRVNRAVSSNSTPIYILPSPEVRMGANSPHEQSPRSRKRSKIDDSWTSKEQRAARTKSGIVLQNHPQHSHNQQCEKPSGDSPQEKLRFREYQAEIWSDRFDDLCAFRRLRGHCHVPYYYSENTLLAKWVKRQRYQFNLRLKGRRNTLTEERIRVLQEVDFVWSSHDAVWEERFQNLLMYKNANGHCLVPSSFRENPQLAVWTKRQRREYKRYQKGLSNSMTPNRIKKLENIGFVWDCRDMNKTKDDSMGNACDDSGIGAAATTRSTNRRDDNIQSNVVGIETNTNFSPLVRGDGLTPTHNKTNNLFTSALQPNRICGKNDQSLVDHLDHKTATYLSKSIRNDRSLYFYGDYSSNASMVPIDSDHGRNRLGHVNPFASQASNGVVNNKSREFVKGTGASTLVSRSFDGTILSARNDRKPPGIPRGDFFSYCHKDLL